MTTSEIIKQSKLSYFQYYRDHNFIYKTDTGFEFIIPHPDLGKATLNSQEKTILLMRYIRQHLKLIQNRNNNPL